MARGKATRKAPLRSVKQKRKPPTKSRRKPVRKKHMTKKNVPQISYKDSHSIGRRKSTNVPTYSESGRLYYDLHVRYGPSVTFENKEEKPPKDANHCCGFESTISDSTTIACKESTGPSSSTKKVNVKWKKKRRLAQKRQSPVKSTAPLNSRREASLNAEAKVNMLFESVKESKNKRRSLPALPTTITKDGVSSESGVKLSPVKLSPSKRTTKARRTRVSEPPPLPVLSPPQKRLAGLNATAIISACIKSSESDNKKPRRGRPPKSSLKSLTPKFVDANSSANENVQTNPTKPSSPLPPFPVTTTIIASSTTQFQKPTPCSSNAITTLATVSADTKVVPASAVSTLERFQSQKVISYGSKCIGVENISRQIIHVPGQSPCVPCTSCSNPVSQQLQQQRIVPNSILPFSSSSQNHSMVMLPDSSSFCPHPPNLITSAADMQHHPCFTTNQFYLSPFSSTNGQHQQQQTFYMSIPSPAPQFQFFSAAPFAYVQPSAQNFMSNNSYMLPMSFSPQLYNGFPFGGGCFVPRPMFAAVPQPPHQLPSQLAPLPQTSLLTEVGSPPTVNQISQRIDRAVSPIKSSPSTSTPVKKPLSGKRNPAAVSMITTVPVVEKEKPSPCLWAWVGEPSEKRIFLKPNSPPVLRFCYPSMQHQKDGMVVSPGDNVLLCSGPDRQGAPHVAKVTALFNDPETGTKMMALLWYYRPESLVPPRRNGVIDCELFASRHCDVNPVDCIDDLAYVYSSLPYARFMALAKYKQECRTHRRPSSIVPPLHKTPASTSTKSEVNRPGDVSEFPEEATISNVFLCRAWYDFHSRRVMRSLKALNNNQHITNTTAYTTNNNGPTITKLQHPQPVTSSSPVGHTAHSEVPKSTTNQPSTEEESSNGRAILETTAELSINWADHGEKIVMALGGDRSLSSRPSSPRKNKASKGEAESVSSLPLPSSS